MAAVSHDPWQHVLALSTEMLAVAGQGDWAKAIDLQQACDEQIRRIPVEAASADTLRRLQQDQQALLDMTAMARDAVAEALARHRTSHRAVSAYLTSAPAD